MSDGPPAAAPLRVGLLLDPEGVPDWIDATLDALVSSGVIRIVLIGVRRTTDTADPPPSRLTGYYRNRHVLGYALLQRAERMLRPGEWHPGFVPLPRPWAADAEIVDIEPECRGFRDIVRGDDVARFATAGLDVILRFGFRILSGPILRAARLGAWSFHHGDHFTNRGGPAAAWEVLEDRPTTGLMLQRLSEELDGGEVLARTEARTVRFWISANRASLYPRSGALLRRCLERAARGEDVRDAELREHCGWDGYSQPLYTIPTNRWLVRHLPSLATDYLRTKRRWRGQRLHWSMAWHHAAGDAATPCPVMRRYREIPTPPDRIWADPFVAGDEGAYWLFFEEQEYTKPHGIIRAWQLGPKGPVGEPITVLERPYHLSFPFLFRHEGAWFMVPETHQRGAIEVYRAERFPDRWTLHGTLLEGVRALDTVLLRHDDARWYLFTSIWEEGFEPSDELSVYVGEGPFGPFRPLPGNPVVSHCARARMAGDFFRAGGRLLRPAQITTPLYGTGITIMEVLELSPERYRERPLQELRGHWMPGLEGLHTLNAAGPYSVIDLLRLVPTGR